ncbi:MAG: 2-phospho-L-lactate guanylyltransferase [Actinomycetes bacterium]
MPIRTFALGNTRLATGLDHAAREELARQLAGRVVTAAGSAPVVIVTSAPEVVEWAHAAGVMVVADPGGLDRAAAAGVAALADLGCVRAVVAHADLPFARSFQPLVSDAGRPVATFVPCHHDDGTPVLSVPVDTPFGFAYGPGSFRRHLAAARAAGLAVRVIRDPDLAFDVDTLADLHELARRDPGLVPGPVTLPS